MKLIGKPKRRAKFISWKLIVWYLILLAIIIILMWKMPTIVRRLPM